MKLKSTNPKFELRHLKMSDSKSYYECQTDPATQKGFMWIPKDLVESRKELKQKISDYKKKKPFGECFAIIFYGEFAGYVELCRLNQKYHEHKGEIGYCIHPKFRGKGLATAAVKLCTDYAFKKYKLKRMVGVCRTFNKASARVLEKAGYKLEGILRKNKWKNGKYLDDCVYARVR